MTILCGGGVSGRHPGTWVSFGCVTAAAGLHRWQWVAGPEEGGAVVRDVANGRAQFQALEGPLVWWTDGDVAATLAPTPARLVTSPRRCTADFCRGRLRGVEEHICRGGGPQSLPEPPPLPPRGSSGDLRCVGRRHPLGGGGLDEAVSGCHQQIPGCLILTRPFLPDTLDVELSRVYTLARYS